MVHEHQKQALETREIQFRIVACTPQHTIQWGVQERKLKNTKSTNKLNTAQLQLKRDWNRSWQNLCTRQLQAAASWLNWFVKICVKNTVVLLFKPKFKAQFNIRDPSTNSFKDILWLFFQAESTASSSSSPSLVVPVQC